MFNPYSPRSLESLILFEVVIISNQDYSPVTRFLYYEVPVAFAGRTLGSYLKHGLNLSTTRIRALKKSQGIWIDNHPEWVSYRLRGGEKLQLFLAPIDQTIISEPVPLSIVYEDSALVVVNKPAGMVVHPVKQYQSGTLANGMLHLWRERNEPASFHAVHRLDRLTSGLVVVAKNPFIHQQMALQLEKGSMRRFYLAICQGAPGKKSGKISLPIQEPERGCKWEVSETGKPASTRFRVLQTFPGAPRGQASLLAVKLFTGRTHQIRIHMANAGAPLWGDPVYGTPEPSFTRPALHAVRLTFKHPLTGQNLKYQAPLPEDFQALLIQLNS